MVSENEGEKIKVVDKRRFDSDGESKASAAMNNDGAYKVQEGGAERRSEHTHSANYETVSYGGFVMGIATQALSLLGEIPNPETNIASVNLDAARQIIDVIAMLVDKTKGNLSAEEDQLTTEVLASLRLAYVRKVDETKSNLKK
ncbi:MAG: DUF1844 domain-containing protein [Deltaproteobacteria bacterium]|nr:DUF1844 domain-containing protein [Deltaproteobacteria bacterium]